MKKYGIFFFLYSSFVFSMETSEILSTVRPHIELLPKKTIELFNFKNESKMGKLWDEVVPGDLVITPDEKGVIIGDHGRVRHAQFDTGDIEVIIKHQCIKKTPLIAVSQKQDGSLVVVSACNYLSEQDNKYVAEYAVYSHGYAGFRYLDFPIQAISLNASGSLLAIANLSSVTIIDLNTRDSKRAVFKKEDFFDDTHWLVDIAMHPTHNWVAIAGSHGDVQWMSYDGKFSNDKQVKTTDKIKKIYYPSEELLYLTDRGEAKSVKMTELLEKDNSQIINTVFFADSSKYEIVAVDLSAQIAVGYWTNDVKIPQDIRQKIKIYRKDEELWIKEFVLTLAEKSSDLEESYNYRTPSGTLASGVSHLLRVALRGKTVIALATDGKIRLWSLPEKNRFGTDAEVSTIKERNQMKVHSNLTSAQHNPPMLSVHETSETIDGVQKRGRSSSTKLHQRSSPRFIHILKGSRESSPTPHSPRKVDNSHEVDEKQYKDKQYYNNG